MMKLRAALGRELLISVGAGAIIRNERGEVLILQRADDATWDIPTGSAEPGETPVAVVCREVREETGLEVRVTGLAGVVGGPRFRHEYSNGDRIEGWAAIFDCEVVGGTLESQDGEAEAFRFVDPAEMPPLTTPYPAELFELNRKHPVFF